MAYASPSCWSPSGARARSSPMSDGRDVAPAGPCPLAPAARHRDHGMHRRVTRRSLTRCLPIRTVSGGPRLPRRAAASTARRSSDSWQAAYNTACVYAALADARAGAAVRRAELRENLEGRVIASLRRVVGNPRSELERPSDWIDSDPDFRAMQDGAAHLPGVRGLPHRPDAAGLPGRLHGRGVPRLSRATRGAGSACRYGVSEVRGDGRAEFVALAFRTSRLTGPVTATGLLTSCQPSPVVIDWTARTAPAVSLPPCT